MDLLKPRFRFSRPTSLLTAALIVSIWAAGSSFAQTGAAEDPSPDAPGDFAVPEAGQLLDTEVPEAGASTGPLTLQLDVSVNGYPIQLVGGFLQKEDGTLTSARSELHELGFKVPGDGPENEQINLSSLSGMTYSYDEASQSIDFHAPDAVREAHTLSIIPKSDLPEAETSTGLVVNYSGYAAANYDIAETQEEFNGASLSIDARAYSKLGVVQQSGIVGTTTFSDFTAVRLDTLWSYSNTERLETYRLGDIISGGLRWSRPIRLGGGQIERNFDLRPDLVTAPLPELEGSAAVPSTLDVYINGAKTYSKEVAPGPYRIDRLPIITGHGTARVVVTDTTGRQTESETPIYSSPELLDTGLFDYALDIGVARRGYGTDSFDYDNQPLAIANLRYGLSDVMTGELHAEVSRDLLEGGVGTVFVAGALGTFNAAVAASQHDGETGFFGFAAWEAQYGSLALQASTARTIGDFTDLAATTETPGKNGKLKGGVPDAIDQFSMSYGFADLDAGAGLSFVHVKPREGNESFILGANLTKSFDNDLSVFANAYMDFGKDGDYGAFVGFSMPLGEKKDNINTSVGAAISKNNWSATAEVAKPLDTHYGSYGWRVTHQEQAARITSAEASYRGSKAIVSGRVSGNDKKVSGNAAIDGSIVASAGGFFLGNPITDSFAIVDAGAEGIDVSYENRFLGKTGKDGKLLVTQMRSHQRNKISIDPENLPINASVAETDRIAVPRALSGVVVDFGVNKDQASAIVILKDSRGDFIVPGSDVHLAGQEEAFVMGYDGEVYLTGVGTANTLTVDMNGTQCSASFDFQADSETQATIGPLTCS